MVGIRVLIIAVSAATGTCFATLAGMSISAMVFPVRRFHVFSLVVAVVAIFLGYLAFRAAVRGRADKEAAAASLSSGMLGALIGLAVMLALWMMFKADTQSFFAHALGKPSWAFTGNRMLAGFVLLGFGAGFIARVPRAAARSAEDDEDE